MWGRLVLYLGQVCFGAGGGRFRLREIVIFRAREFERILSSAVQSGQASPLELSSILIDYRPVRDNLASRFHVNSTSFLSATFPPPLSLVYSILPTLNIRWIRKSRFFVS